MSYGMSGTPDKRLWTGHCWLCAKPCLDVEHVWPSGHALAGQPRSFGSLLGHPKRVTFVRMRSGHLTDVVLCASCEPTPDRIVELNELLCLRDRMEGSPWWNEAVGRRKDTASQRWARLRTTLLYHADPILGEIARRPLAEAS